MNLFAKHIEYKRSDLHNRYGGNRQSGISSSKNHPIIMLFSSAAGEEYGYQDSWYSDKEFHYAGEGQHGDMEFVRGNKAIRDHVMNDKELHLFTRIRKAYVRYEGKFEYDGHHIEQRSDNSSQLRNMIVFHLRLLE